MKKSEAASTEACIEGGLIRRSDEAAVMVAEQRDRITPAEFGYQLYKEDE